MERIKANIKVEIDVTKASNRVCGICRFYIVGTGGSRCLLFNTPCSKIKIQGKLRPFGRCEQCLEAFGTE